MLAFLGIVVAAALAVTRTVGIDATAAGLIPIATGYLFAHYLTYVLIDGQRIVIALSDPFQRGWDLIRLRLPRADRRRGCRRAWSGPCSWPRSSAGTCSGRGAGTWSRPSRRRPTSRHARSATARSPWPWSWSP